MAKIILENLVARLNEQEEKELPANQTIRFELEHCNIIVKMHKDGISIVKINKGVGLDTIIIEPDHCNKIYIK